MKKSIIIGLLLVIVLVVFLGIIKYKRDLKNLYSNQYWEQVTLSQLKKNWALKSNLNKKDEKLFTPFYYFIMNRNSIDMLDYLISIGADINSSVNKEKANIIHFAVLANKNLKFIKRLEKYYKKNDKQTYGKLMFVALDGNSHLNVLKYCIQRGFDVNTRDDYNYTLLKYLIFYPDNRKFLYQRIKFLLDSGADPNFEDENGTTILMNAAEKDSLAIVKLLIDYGAKINKRNHQMASAIDYTLFNEKYGKEIREFLKKKGAYHYYENNSYISTKYINSKDYNDRTPLMFAAATASRPKIIKDLIKNKANFDNVAIPFTLGYAVKYNPNINIYLTLYKIGIKKYGIQDMIHKTTPMYYPLFYHYEDEKYYNTIWNNLKSYFKETDIKNIIIDDLRYGYLDELKFFLQKVNKDILPAFQMYQLASNKMKSLVLYNILLSNGIDVNATDENGTTPLIYATKNNYDPRIIDSLLKHGANIDKKDKFGKTALDYAKNNANKKILKILEKYKKE